MSLITEDDANNLCEYVIKEYIESNKLAKDITKKTLQKIYDNSSCPKSEILIELINLLKFSKNTHTFLLSLEPEKRKIVLNFPDYIIKILIKLSFSDIKYLLTKYNYLLNNDVLLTDEIIKFAVENDGLSLKYVPEDKMTDKIIKLAIENDGLSLKYVPEDKMTDEIIKLAVENNGNAFKYIPECKISDEIIEFAVEKDYRSLAFVQTALSGLSLESLSETVQFPKDKIITLAVINNGFALQFVPENKMTDIIIELAVHNNAYALRYVPEDKMTNEIIKFAIKNDSYVLLYVPKNKLTDEIIKFAVETDGCALQYIPDDRKTEEIIKIAVQQNRLASQFVRLSKEKLIELGI
jgi:hypothetical protein